MTQLLGFLKKSFKHWAKLCDFLILSNNSAEGKDKLNKMRVNEKCGPSVVSFYKFVSLKKS